MINKRQLRLLLDASRESNRRLQNTNDDQWDRIARLNSLCDLMYRTMRGTGDTCGICGPDVEKAAEQYEKVRWEQ